MNHSCHMPSELHLISWPWKYFGGDKFLYQTLVQLVYLIFIMLNDTFEGEPTTFIMWFLFLTETMLDVWNALSRSSNYIDFASVAWAFLKDFYFDLSAVYQDMVTSLQVSQVTNFDMHWLKSLIILFTCFLIYIIYLLSLIKT